MTEPTPTSAERPASAPIRTVGDLMAALAGLDPGLPVGLPCYAPDRLIVGQLAVLPERRLRRVPPVYASGGTVWYELGTEQALYHEGRGGVLETVVVVAEGP